MTESYPDRDTTEPLSIGMGRYRLERPLGKGGMGNVVLAKDTMLHRPVALKRLVGGSDPALRRRMLLEAQKASRVNNPRIAAVYDVFEEGPELILVMEYVEGRTLREHLRDRPGLEDFWDIADQCLDALESAHQAGVVHGDIKPENVMITSEGHIKLLDFGLARLLPLDDATTVTTTQSAEHGLRGTPPYLPPESLRGLPADARSDVFSLGVMFYELLAGHRPFDGFDRAETYRKILNEPPPPFRESGTEVSPDLETVVLGMLVKEPEARYASMALVRESLHAARRGDSVPSPALTHDSPPVIPVPEPAPDRRLAFALVGALLVLAAAFFVWRQGPSLWTSALPSPQNLVVLPPVTTGGNPDTPFFALGAVQVLGIDLGRAAGQAALPFSRLSDALREEVTDAAQAHARLGADLALASEFRAGDKQLSVKQSLVETKTERVIRTKEHTFAASASPLEILETLISNARRMLDLPQDAKPSRKTRFGTEGDGSMKLYLEGLGRSATAKTNEDLDAAAHSFDLASNIDPAFAQARAAKGWALYTHYARDKDTSWLQRAVTEANAALAENPNLALGYKALGYASYRLGEGALAKRSLERAVALDPGDFDAYREWGRLYGRQGDADSEEVVYRRAIDRNGYDWRPHYWLAMQLYARGRFDESRQCLEDVVRLAPENYIGYSYRGGMRVMEGKYQDAIADLERSIALYPTAEALSNLGTAYFNLRRMSDAILTYNRSFQFGFDNYLLWINLGDAYRWSAGQDAQAMKAYREAIERGRKEFEARPYHFEIQAELAPVLARVGAADSARAWMASSLEKGGDNPNINYCAALMYWELGQPEAGLGYLEKAVREGYPRTWLRDSAVFDAWRSLPRFQAIAAGPASPESSASPNEGGS